ncbi:MAG: radical SAM-associated putative lipoprotein [Marinilabiliaceae bacterium]|nr:radical SAM-associated putative lipoprotein [Marinilabiliaceae bacterium]
MKVIRVSFLKRYNALISFALSLIGFACSTEDSPDMYGSPIVEYGSPYATFIVKGKIESADKTSPISNAQVVMNNDTVYSNSEGNYQIQTHEFPIDQSFKMEINDIDSTKNGAYQSTDTIVDFIDPKFEVGSGWYSGETTKEVNIKLESKK